MTDQANHQNQSQQSSLEKLYNFEQTTILINLQILPTVQQQRSVIVAVGIKNDPPLIQTIQLDEIELPPLLQQMLLQLQTELPQRQIAKEQLLENQRLEQLQRNYKRRQVEVPALPTQTDTSQPSPQTKQLTLL